MADAPRSPGGGIYARLAQLPLRIEDVVLAGLRRSVAAGFERHTTVVRLRGDGLAGLGEDVTYDAGDQLAFQRAGVPAGLADRHTLEGFSRRLDELELFPASPRHEDSRAYRRWAFESAALDLALQQNGLSLCAALGRRVGPLRFVVSVDLGKPPTIEPLRRLLALDSRLRFKLDANEGWTASLARELAATGAVDTVDFKGAYHGTPVDQPPDPELYHRVAEAFPTAWLEDPALTPETEAVLADHWGRVTWDAPIHSVADVEKLTRAPRTLNLKPSRAGRLDTQVELYEHCEERGIGMYGGGQFELGPGREQIQYLAALFHPDAPNDTAPPAYNDPAPQAGLPGSPLELRPARHGFRLDGEGRER